MISKTSLVYFFGLYCWAVFSVFGLLVSWACDVLLICTYLSRSAILIRFRSWRAIHICPCSQCVPQYTHLTVLHVGVSFYL